MSKRAQYSLLYVEDELLIREMTIEYLEDFFTIIYEASNGEEALKLYNEKNPDIIITDIEIPKMSGLELVSKIRKEDDTTPIIITTAYADTKYLLQATELNLVKYLLKPIEEEKLIEALERCFSKIESRSQNIVELTKEHKYDIVNRVLTCKDKNVSLTYSQSKLLELLIKNKDRAVTYLEIENYIWQYKGMSDAAVRSLVHDIRKIISKNIIENVSKIGYKINLL